MTSMRCDLDLDPFDAPMSSRIYLDYKNNSEKAISAVKFRVRFVDGEGKERGTFHAVDQAYTGPSGDHGQKWKRDFTLHPQVVGMKVRVLQVKYGDGSDWESTKMQELANPHGGSASGAGGSGNPGQEAAP